MCIYDIEIDTITVEHSLTRIGNQIFKLLPMREEEQDWEKPLETLLVELSGMYSLFPNRDDLFTLLCKLEGLRHYKDKIDFMLYRRVIFECCSLIDKIKTQI